MSVNRVIQYFSRTKSWYCQHINPWLPDLAKEPRQVVIGVRQVPGKPHVPRIRHLLDQLPEPESRATILLGKQSLAIRGIHWEFIGNSGWFWVILGVDAS